MSAAGGVERHDPVHVHDGDAVTERLGFFHVMGGQHDGAPLGMDLVDKVPQVAARLRVEAGRGLVQEHEIGRVDEGGGDGEPLLLAAGELADGGPRLVGQADFRQQARDGRRFAVEAGEQVGYLGEHQLLEV